MKKEKRIIVGVIDGHDYAVKRNIHNKAVHLGVLYFSIESYERLFLHEWINFFNLDVSWQMKPGFLRTVLLDRSLFYISPMSNTTDKVDIIHVWNQVCDTENLWGVTLETALPHLVEPNGKWLNRLYEDYVKQRDFELVARDNCRFIITFSKRTYVDLKQQALLHSPKLWEKLKDKTYVLLPPQKRIASDEEIRQKFSENTLNILFVGRYFLIKGGMETLEALRRLKNKFDFHFTVIGGLEEYHQGNFNPDYSAEEIAKAKNLLETAPWITWYKQLDYIKVLSLMKQSHIGMFPSYCDTFGYVVLEMQAAGCPVLTTDINAFPEINDSERGWICRLNTPIRDYKRYSDRIREELTAQITSYMETAMSERNNLLQKALKAAATIEEKFSPEQFAANMYKIYKKAMEGGN